MLQFRRPERPDLYPRSWSPAVLSDALCTVDVETRMPNCIDKRICTLPFIIHGMLRPMFLLHNNGSGQGSPRDLVTDRQRRAAMLVRVVAAKALIA